MISRTLPGGANHTPNRANRFLNCLIFIVALLVIFGSGDTAAAQTYVNRFPEPNDRYSIRNVTLEGQSVTWTTTGGPYILEAYLTVAADANLTIESGVEVRIQSDQGMRVNGTLNAVNADFDLLNEGKWDGIYFGPDAGSSELDNCRIANAGSHMGVFHGANRYTSMYLDQSSPSINGCRFEGNAGHGIELYASQATLTGNEFINIGSGKYAMVYNTLDTFPVISGNTSSGTGIHGIYVPSGRMTVSGVWMNPGATLSYILPSGSLTIGDSDHLDTTLSIAAGVKVLTTTGIYVNGTLIAEGTAQEPILFSANSAEPAPGQWDGIYFGPTSGASEFHHCTIQYAGDHLGVFHGANQYSSIYVDNSSPLFNSVTVEKGSSNGIELQSSNALIQNAIIRDHHGHGLIAQAGSRPSIAETLISGNGGGGNKHPVWTDAGSVPDPENVTLVDNPYQGIQIAGGTITEDSTWKIWGPTAPYVITGDVNVETGVTLSIEPGVVLKVSGPALRVHGTLNADAGDESIIFTSVKDDSAAGDTNGDGEASIPEAGDWKGIYLSPDSGDSILNRCALRFTGDHLGVLHGFNRYTSIYINQSNPSITDCWFENPGSHGIELYASQATLTGNEFINIGSGKYAMVYNTLDTFPVISGNTSSGTGIHGIYVPSGRMTVSGVWMNPGATLSYILPSGSLTIGDSDHLDTTLSIAAGVKVLTTTGIYVNGTLIAEGTAQEPILFSANSAEPAPGQWDGIYFGPTSGASEFHHCTIQYAGDHLGVFHGANQYSSLYIDGSSPILDHLTVAHSASEGILMYESDTVLTDSLIRHNVKNALLLQGGASPTLVNNTIVENTGNGIKIQHGSTPSAINNIITGNGGAGIYIPVVTDANGPTIRNNLFFTNTDGALRVTNESNQSIPGNVSENPVFRDAVNGNYRLAAGSPAVDTGDTAMVNPYGLDLAGHLRVFGAQVDIGAYEFEAPAISRVVDALIRASGESEYTGDNLFTLGDQKTSQSLDALTAAVFDVMIQYEGNVPTELQLTTSFSPEDRESAYFDGDQDITSAILSETGYRKTDVMPGETLNIRLEIRPTAGVIPFRVVEQIITVKTSGSQNASDQVAAVTTYQPDIRASMERLADGRLAITWSGELQNMTVEITHSLKQPIEWTPYEGSPELSDDRFVMPLDQNAEIQFFRLINQP
ncbi:right-handed parallel beta-helix repeat-containing protein [bacterium]|nr:right-handed parallel beta-helix repeat-containing protein [bacterium]